MRFHATLLMWEGRGFLGQEIHLPMRVHPRARGVPAKMSATRPSLACRRITRRARPGSILWTSHRRLRPTQAACPELVEGLRPQVAFPASVVDERIAFLPRPIQLYFSNPACRRSGLQPEGKQPEK